MAAEGLHRLAGGEARLRKVVEDFYGRVFADVMIGFFFHGKDRERLVQKELELVLSLLGAPVEYTGRPIRAAHEGLPILGGHFLRRRRILEETLADHHVPERVVDAWLQHTDSLRPQVTADKDSECRTPLAQARDGRVLEEDDEPGA